MRIEVPGQSEAGIDASGKVWQRFQFQHPGQVIYLLSSETWLMFHRPIELERVGPFLLGKMA
jgi:hypothetical protein